MMDCRYCYGPMRVQGEHSEIDATGAVHTLIWTCQVCGRSKAIRRGPVQHISEWPLENVQEVRAFNTPEHHVKT